MADQTFMTIEDYDGDPSTTSFSVLDVADAADFATWDGLQVTLRSQLTAWTIGRVRTQGYRIVTNEQLPGAASSPVAQKSTQAIFEMQDDVTGSIYTERLPCADLTKAADGSSNPAWIASGGLTIINPAHAGWATLKAAVEAVWESPNGNSGILNRVYIEE